MSDSGISTGAFVACAATGLLAVLLSGSAHADDGSNRNGVLVTISHAGQRTVVGSACWADAPPDAAVVCVETPETINHSFRFVLSDRSLAPLDLTIEYETFDLSATGPEDYVAQTGTLVIPKGERSSQLVEITIVDDDRDEPDEQFGVRFFDPSDGANLAADYLIVTILDNDPAPALAVADATGAEDGGELVFAVTLDAPSGVAVTVDYATSDGTAVGGEDYRPATGTLTFAPGDVRAGVRVLVLDDALDEPDETFNLALSNASGATVSVGEATGMIADDDPAPALAVAGASGTEDGGELVFEVTLDAPSGVAVTVDYATSDGTAAGGEDYEPAAGALTFAPGDVLKGVLVLVLDDALDEPDETFNLALSNASGATVSVGEATGTIADDDPAPALAVAGASGTEDGGELVFEVTLDAPSGVAVTVDYATSDGTAAGGEDYEPAAGALTFAPGDVLKGVLVLVLDDALDEPDETFNLALSNASGATISVGEATGTIADDDPAPALAVAGASGAEDAGELVFEVTLDAPSGMAVTVDYATSDGTAVGGEDYEPAAGALTFAPGDVRKGVLVLVLDDALDEPDETFNLALSNASGATISVGEATGMIVDDDLAPAMAVGQPADVILCVGGDLGRLELADYFAGEGLRYAASVSLPSVARVSLSGQTLTLVPVAEGEAHVRVTVANDTSEAAVEFAVRVVTDPAELAAVEMGLAAVGRNLLGEVTAAVGKRFEGGFGGSSPRASSSATGLALLPTATRFPHRRVGPASSRIAHAARPMELAADFGVRGSPAFAFSLGGSSTGKAGPFGLSLWGSGGARRFRGGEADIDGSLRAVQLGADMRSGMWLAGLSASASEATADYRFRRSVDACGGEGYGEGMLKTNLTSVHPYVGRRFDDGWVWGTVGWGRGEAMVERCESGRRSEADLRIRLGALGGQHPIADGGRRRWSVVEDLGLLRLETGGGPGPLGDREVSVGRARLGVEAAGSVPEDCPRSLSSYVRALARGDWGDGETGAGVEVAAGVRFRDRGRRIGADAGVRTVAVHSSTGYRETGVRLSVSILPRPDGTGLQLSVSSRRGDGEGAMDRWREVSPWSEARRRHPGQRTWRTDLRVAYGTPAARGLARPFVELDASGGGHAYRGGLRYEFDANRSLLRLEFAAGRRPHAGGGHHVALTGEARF